MAGGRHRHQNATAAGFHTLAAQRRVHPATVIRFTLASPPPTPFSSLLVGHLSFVPICKPSIVAKTFRVATCRRRSSPHLISCTTQPAPSVPPTDRQT